MDNQETVKMAIVIAAFALFEIWLYHYKNKRR